jgi:hypothetical protein
MTCEVCTNFISNKLITPQNNLDFAVLTPFVTITVAAGGKSITVGPNSMPPDNTVSILNMEFGAVGVAGGGGQSLKVELIDERGGEFYKFAESLWKCISTNASTAKVTAEWGWIGLNCDGSPQKIPEVPTKVQAILVGLDVSFAEGKFKYTMNATDIGPITSVAKSDETFGSNKNWIPITQAIRELCENVEPKCNIEFKNLNKNGQPLIWEDGTEEGPKNYWPSKLGSKIEIIHSWIHDYTTIDQKGFTLLNDNTKENTLVLTEQMRPEEGSKGQDNMSLGTFVVNGGECSVVLDFTTNFNWTLGLSSHNIGGTVDQNGQAVKAEEKYNATTNAPEQKQGGIATNTIINSRANETKPQEKVAEKTVIANQEALKSMIAPGGGAPIEAQLRIMGMPFEDFIFPIFKGKLYAGIIVINPFNLESSGDCPNWLQTSLCNKVLSNKYWVIEGCNHMIKGGNYTTTLKLTLPVPMIEFTPGTPAGGPGSAGYSDFKCAPS